MIKVHHPETDQEALIKVARIVNLIDGASTIKEAASSVVSEKLIRDNLPDDRHFGVHLIGLGDGEDYGQNRNGDFFPKRANRDYHHTFVTQGHFFREHENRDPKKAIGIVKASAHNTPMSRVEILLHGSKDKAEEEYELAKAGKALSFSMSCRVPNDRCNACGHVATKSANYCTHLKHHMNDYIPDLQKFAYAINDKPTFFDISRVKNPADRIAHYLEYQFGPDMAKAASNRFLFSDQLASAEGVSLPLIGFEDPDKQRILEKLAACEQYIEDVRNGVDVPHDGRYHFVKHAAANIFSKEELSQQDLDDIRSVEPGTLFRKLADARVLLPFRSFVAYATGRTMDDVLSCPTVEKAAACLGDSMRNLMAIPVPGGLANLLTASSPFMAGADLNGGDKVQRFMDHASEKFQHPTEAPSLGKIIRISITAGPVATKQASSVEPDITMAGTLAQTYAMYKVAFAQGMSELHSDFAVDDNSALLLTVRGTI